MKICFISLPKNISTGEPIKPAFRSPPITHLWLAAVLRRGGHSVSVIDALTLHLSADEILNVVAREKPDLVGFTVFTNALADVLYMARQIKGRFPQIRVAVGGYHANSRPPDLYADAVDYVFAGETEYGLLELGDRFDAANPSLEGILGLHHSDVESGAWIANPPQPPLEKLDDIPILPYEMILDNGYNAWWTVINPRRERYMATVTAKGCPMGCSFCDISKTEGARYRAMSVERVLEELRYMSSLGITHVEFRDPSFTVDLDRTARIAQGIIDQGIKIEWGGSSTIRRIKDPAFLRLLYRSGCRFLFYGVESGNPEILRREKKVSPEQVFKAVQITQQAGIQAHCSFIFGLEGETRETMQQTLDMALKLNPHTASFSIAIPYPGTKLYDAYDAKGYIQTYDWSLYDGEHPVFETEHVTPEMLESFLTRAHRAFYFRPSYVWKRLTKVRSLHELWFYASVAAQMVFNVAAYKR